MSENQYGFKYDEYGNTKEILVYTSGIEATSLSFVNKGTAFSYEERKSLGIQAVLPPSVRSIEGQVYNSKRIVDEKQSDLEKYIFIRSMFDRNATLTHALIRSDIEKFMGLIYVPTVGDAVKKYSTMFRKPGGLHFYPDNIDQAENILRRYLHRDIRIAVVTDNGGVLGIGDQGAGGIAISLGKLMLYTQGAGIAPWHCLPISLDVGTDNQDLLNDPFYLGWRHKRLQGEAYLSFIGRFARALRNVFPNTVCQWEDFSSQNAFAIRDSFADELISFNDDIQGTGAVTLAAIYSAMKLKSESLVDQKFLVCGSGVRGIGIAEQLENALCDEGLNPTEARERIFVHEKNSILSTRNRLPHYKMKYAKDPEVFEWVNDAGKLDIEKSIGKAGITVLVGACSEGGCFTRQIVEEVSRNTERPVIIPLSGLEKKGDAQVGDIVTWSNGKALVAKGGACQACGGSSDEASIALCNNALVFPGVGLGAIVAGARQILPEFFTEAAKAVSEAVPKSELTDGRLVPRIDTFPDVAKKVAHAVAMSAIKHEVSRPCAFADYKHENDSARIKKLINGMRWEPDYLPLTPM